jgi:hypothetical protein
LELARHGRDVPALKDRPSLSGDQLWYVKAFSILNLSRGYTDFGTPQHISLHDLLAFCDLFPIPGLTVGLDAREELFGIIKSADVTYLSTKANVQVKLDKMKEEFSKAGMKVKKE